MAAAGATCACLCSPTTPRSPMILGWTLRSQTLSWTIHEWWVPACLLACCVQASGSSSDASCQSAAAMPLACSPPVPCRLSSCACASLVRAGAHGGGLGAGGCPPDAVDPRLCPCQLADGRWVWGVRRAGQAPPPWAVAHQLLLPWRQSAGRGSWTSAQLAFWAGRALPQSRGWRPPAARPSRMMRQRWRGWCGTVRRLGGTPRRYPTAPTSPTPTLMTRPPAAWRIRCVRGEATAPGVPRRCRVPLRLCGADCGSFPLASPCVSLPTLLRPAEPHPAPRAAQGPPGRADVLLPCG